MAVKKVVVCEAQIPFVTGGAEHLARSLVRELVKHGYETALVSVPFKSYPKGELLTHAAAWRLLDLSESNGESIDLAITTKFPTYFVRHPHKVSWLIHQHRSAYELCGTEFGDFEHTELDVDLREQLVSLDSQMLRESRRLFTIARNVSDRLEKFNGLYSEPLYHPPRLAERLRSGPHGNYVLSIGRLETIKRTDMLVRSMQWVDPALKLIVAGTGTQGENLAALAQSTDVGDRIEFRTVVSDDDLLTLYENALGVVYVPFDEDYGYVSLEAFLARRPVITATDSGGTLEFVRDGTSGLVCEPEPEALADAINRIGADRQFAASLGSAGFEMARQITWDGVVEKLVGAA